jgi:hypothetical protein
MSTERDMDTPYSATFADSYGDDIPEDFVWHCQKCLDLLDSRYEDRTHRLCSRCTLKCKCGAVATVEGEECAPCFIEGTWDDMKAERTDGDEGWQMIDQVRRTGRLQ